MGKTAVVYWSGTGNTEAMARAITEGLKSENSEVTLYNVSEITAEQALGFERLVLGCPSMGAEVLEEMAFDPFFSDIEKGLSGKKVALFGSYGWGDGEWMRDWQSRTEATGASLFEEGLIINETPSEDDLAQCAQFGARFSRF